MFITLDHNCIIALENPLKPSEAANASALQELMALCKSQNIPVGVYWNMWMENPRQGAENQDLKARLKTLGLEHVEIRDKQTLWFNIDGIPTADVWTEIGFLAWVHHSMFPNIAFRFYEYVEAECTKQGIATKDMFEANRDKVRFFASPLTPEEIADPTKQELRERWEKWYRKWNNAKMDSLTICAHLSWGEGIFVTSNTHDFQRRTQELRKRAPTLTISTPAEAVIAIRALAVSTATISVAI